MAALCQAGQARKFVPRSTKFLAERIAKERPWKCAAMTSNALSPSQAEALE
jgi:hypothetical protein